MGVGGNILASLDNYLAETVEGAREPFNPHSPTPGLQIEAVNGLASAFFGCQQCHGSKVALQSTNGSRITVDVLKPNADGKATNLEAIARVYPTPTTDMADLILPSAAWIEREGIFGNTERRTQHWEKMIEPPGDAKEDAWQIMEVAKRKRMGMGMGRLFPWPDHRHARRSDRIHRPPSSASHPKRSSP